MGFRLAGRWTTGMYISALGQGGSVYAYQPLLYGYQDYRDDIACTGLAQDIFAVGTDGVCTELDTLGYLIAAEALPYQGEYLALTAGQVCQIFAVHHIVGDFDDTNLGTIPGKG